MTTATTPTDSRQWAAMNGQGFSRFELPPTEVLPAPVAKAANRYTELLSQWTEAAAEVRAIDTRPARAQAEAADRDAYADAIAAGKPDPGEPNLKAYEDRVRAAARRKAASAKAVDTAARELVAAVDANRDALDKKASTRLAQAEAAYLTHVDAFPAIALELAEARRAAAWPADLERRQPWGRPMPLPVLGAMGGNITADSLARALRSIVTPPDPEPASPAHITDEATGASLADSGTVAA